MLLQSMSDSLERLYFFGIFCYLRCNVELFLKLFKWLSVAFLWLFNLFLTKSTLKNLNISNKTQLSTIKNHIPINIHSPNPSPNHHLTSPTPSEAPSPFRTDCSQITPNHLSSPSLPHHPPNHPLSFQIRRWQQ